MVGGAVAERVLHQSGIDTMLVPTVLYGRHPGWGEPGGGPVEQDMFQSVLSGISDNGMLHFADIVLTGGGSGETAKPFVFALENVVYA